jgi:WhiB family transcriptional regulator, redox-sensing transcriptional regulator
MAWTDQATCRGADTEMFFPPRGMPSKDIYPIIEIYCNVCPVKQECLEYALENVERNGIWGGTTGRERRYIASKRTQLRKKAS